MSLVTTFKDAPRLVRRQTSQAASVVERPLSPSRHMRIVSACSVLPPPATDGQPPEQTHSRKRSATSASWSLAPPGRHRRPSVSPQRSSSPSSATSSPGSVVPPAGSFASSYARSPLYSPRSPLAQRQSPTGSYFPYVPSAPPSPNATKASTSSAAAAAAAAAAPLAPPAAAAGPSASASTARSVAPPPQPPASTPPVPPELTRKHTRSHSLGLDSPALTLPKPSVVDLTAPSITMPSPLSKATAARMPELSRRPAVEVDSTRFAHTLSIRLPGYAADEVTLTVARNEAIKIVADKWSAAADDLCHLEWLVTFAPRDANMSGIHASFSKEILTVTVPRSRVENSYLSTSSL